MLGMVKGMMCMGSTGNSTDAAIPADSLLPEHTGRPGRPVRKAGKSGQSLWQRGKMCTMLPTPLRSTMGWLTTNMLAAERQA